MHYLIDGYNLLFLYLDDDQDLRTERENLIEAIQQISKDLHLNITIIFDGNFQYGEESGLAYVNPLVIAYSHSGQSADDYIVEKVTFSSNPNEYTVVTSDKKLAREVKSRGANTKTIQNFLKWIEKKKNTHREHDFQDTTENMQRLRKIFEKRLNE